MKNFKYTPIGDRVIQKVTFENSIFDGNLTLHMLNELDNSLFVMQFSKVSQFLCDDEAILSIMRETVYIERYKFFQHNNLFTLVLDPYDEHVEKVLDEDNFIIQVDECYYEYTK